MSMLNRLVSRGDVTVFTNLCFKDISQRTLYGSIVRNSS